LSKYYQKITFCYKTLEITCFLLLWLVLPKSKIKVRRDCCSLITIHEEAFPAAFPVSNGGEPIYKILEIYMFFITLVGSPRIKNKSPPGLLFLGCIPRRAARGRLSSFKWGRTIYKILEIYMFFITLVGSPRIKNKSSQDVLLLDYNPRGSVPGRLSSFKWGEPSNKYMKFTCFLLLWLVLPKSKIKVAKMCCSLITIHEKAFLAAFPVSNGENLSTKYLALFFSTFYLNNIFCDNATHACIIVV
jgi:hypothetical protein